MTCYPVEVKKDGEIVIHYETKEGKKINFAIAYNPNQMEAQVEMIKYESPEDVGVKARWGESLRRINFKVKAPKTKDTFVIQLKTLTIDN